MQPDKQLDEILRKLYLLLSSNDSLLNQKSRTMEEWFAHKDADLFAAKAELEALLNSVVIEEQPDFMKPGGVIPYETVNGKEYVRLSWLQEQLKNLREKR